MNTSSDSSVSSLKSQATTADPSIIFFLNPLLITPPAPKAGTILAIRARLLPIQSRPTLLTLCCQPILFPFPAAEEEEEEGRLYRSRPHRCSGVLSNCIAAGARNCAALCLLKRDSSSLLKGGSNGAIDGGRLKDANTVSESRMANSA